MGNLWCVHDILVTALGIIFYSHIKLLDVQLLFSPHAHSATLFINSFRSFIYGFSDTFSFCICEWIYAWKSINKTPERIYEKCRGVDRYMIFFTTHRATKIFFTYEIFRSFIYRFSNIFFFRNIEGKYVWNSINKTPERIYEKCRGVFRSFICAATSGL